MANTADVNTLIAAALASDMSHDLVNTSGRGHWYTRQAVQACYRCRHCGHILTEQQIRLMDHIYEIGECYMEISDVDVLLKYPVGTRVYLNPVSSTLWGVVTGYDTTYITDKVMLVAVGKAGTFLIDPMGAVTTPESPK